MLHTWLWVLLTLAPFIAARVIDATSGHSIFSSLRNTRGACQGLGGALDSGHDTHAFSGPGLAGAGSRELLQVIGGEGAAPEALLPPPVLVGTPEEFIAAARNSVPYILVTNHMDFTQLGGSEDPLVVIGSRTEVVRVRLLTW